MLEVEQKEKTEELKDEAVKDANTEVHADVNPEVVQEEVINNEEIKEEDNKPEKKKSNKKFKILIIVSIVLLLAVAIFLLVQFFGAPIVKLNGEDVEKVEYGTSYIDKGVMAYTKLKDISSSVITESNVDTSKIGIYEVKYKVPYLNSYQEYKRSVMVIDSKAPQMELKGDSTLNIDYNAKYEEPGYSAIDEYDGDISEKVEIEKVDINNSKYEYHYKIKDSSGNTSELVRTINLVDATAPVITIKGKTMMSVLKGNTYNDEGATAKDNKDGDISSKIITTGSVDTSKEGTYSITYTAKDEAGNEAKAVRTVIVGNSETTGVIYLTFDDGPSANTTPKILQILKDKGVKATFFIINYSDSNEALVKQEAAEGHAIGIHGYSHTYSEIYSSVDACYNNIIKLQDKIYKTTGQRVKILRFPGGASNTVSKKYCAGVMSKISKKVLDEGFKYFDWNVLSGDAGDVKTKEGVYKNVVNGLKPNRNNIVLMHDFSGNNKTVEALPEIIDYGIAHGYKFEVITTNTEMYAQKIQN